eukprot:5767808-Alexandrium_andersonii.AAC.1
MERDQARQERDQLRQELDQARHHLAEAEAEVLAWKGQEAMADQTIEQLQARNTFLERKLEVEARIKRAHQQLLNSKRERERGLLQEARDIKKHLVATPKAKAMSVRMK